MRPNIEQAITGVRSEAAQRAARFERVQKPLQRDLQSPITRFFSGKRINGEIDRFANAQEREQQTIEALDSITDLNILGGGAWTLQAKFHGGDVDIRRIVKDGKPLYAIKVNGQTPPDNVYKGFADLYTLAVYKIQEEIRIGELIDEIRGHGSGNTGRAQTEQPKSTDGSARINPKDHLGYFKALGMDPDALEGLTEEEIEARIKANYRIGAMHAHPDRNQDQSDARMKQLNNAQDVLLDSKKRQDYMNRRGDFDPRNSR